MAAAMTTSELSLPPRLMKFFTRYPPRLYGAHFTGESVPTPKQKIAIAGNKKTGEPPTATNEQIQVSSIPVDELSTDSLLDPETQEPIFQSGDKPPNPFIPYRNPATGRWRGATVSLRQQADLFKLARVYGVEALLPASRKSTAFKEARLLERGMSGPSIKGIGEGQQVKGHKWERTMGTVLQKRITAMEKMPELIREWRKRGNGKGWKKYPK